MATMTSKPAKSLEIRVLYCKDLRSFNFFQKLSVYASVSLSSDDNSLKLHDHDHDHDRRRTPTDRDGDGNPEWNHTLSLDLTEILSSLPHDAYDRVFVRFDLFHEGIMFGDKRIGEVHVALSEVIEPEGRGSARFVSYQVKNPEGKPNGVLTFAYKFEGELDCDSIRNGFAAIAGFPIVRPVEETSGSSGSATSSGIHYPKIDLEEHVVEETSYYPPPGTRYNPPQAPPLPGFPILRRRRRLLCKRQRAAVVIILRLSPYLPSGRGSTGIIMDTDTTAVHVAAGDGGACRWIIGDRA